MEPKLTEYGKATILLKLRPASKLSWCVCVSGSLLLFLLALGFGLTVQLVHLKFGYLHENLHNYSGITSTIYDELNYMARHSCAKSPLAKQYQIAYITTKSGTRKHVLCDTVTDGGGWIIIQRRAVGDANFSNASKNQFSSQGIGNHYTDFWKSLSWIKSLCGQTNPCELRIDMKFKGTPHSPQIKPAADTKYHALYDQFYLEYKDLGHWCHRLCFRGGLCRWWCSNMKWLLFVSNYSASSTAGDALSSLSNTSFTTSLPCNMRGAWWSQSGSCPSSNLNGKWGGTDGGGVIWSPLTGHNGTLTFVEMKIRLK